MSSISTEQAANDLEKILTEELDELQKAGGKIRNHRQYLLTNRHTDPEGHAKEAAVIEEAGIEIYEKMIRPAARKLDGRTYSPDPRICTGTYQSALMMHKILPASHYIRIRRSDDCAIQDIL